MMPSDDQHRRATRFERASALAVHGLTAFGAALGLLAMFEAVREHWSAMFAWLGLALIVDGIDGPMARWRDVARLQPDISGDALDLVVDFTTYVFVPAYAIAQSRLLLPLAAPLIGIGIVVSSALYFADRRMKADDNHFRGFPALWNAAAFYLFLLRPSPVIASLAMAVLIVLTFVPFHVVHPVRVARGRRVTLALMALWAVLAVFALYRNFDVSWPVTVALSAIGLYVLFSDFIIRRLRSAVS